MKLFDKERRRLRRERIAVILGIFTSKVFGTDKVGYVVIAGVVVLIGIVIWRML